jgi:folate-binding protein YgfZ
VTPLDELALLRDGAALVDRRDRGHVLTTGPDAFSFLQALVSADLDAIGDGDGARSLLLSPQGKLDVAFRVLHVDGDAWLDTDPGLGAPLAASLLRFKIRVDAEVIDRSAAWAMVSLIGPEAVRRFAAPVPDRPDAHAAAGTVRVVRTDLGLDLLGGRDAIDDVVATLRDDGWPVAGPGAYDAFRIEQGIPRQPVDIDASTIPQEAELELEAVSFTKGCFLGQELVCRIDSRGHVNRFLRRLVDVDGERPVAGAELRADDKVVGSVTSVTASPFPVIALGYVRRELEPGATVEVRWPEGSARATVAPRRS